MIHELKSDKNVMSDYLAAGSVVFSSAYQGKVISISQMIIWCSTCSFLLYAGVISWSIASKNKEKQVSEKLALRQYQGKNH